MARVTLVLEDVNQGALDGAVAARYLFDPPLPNDFEELSEAQCQGLMIRHFLEEKYGAIEGTTTVTTTQGENNGS